MWSYTQFRYPSTNPSFQSLSGIIVDSIIAATLSMASSSFHSPSAPSGNTPPQSVAEAPIPDDSDDQGGDMPLTMAASVILTSLPKDAAAALEGAGDLPQGKVTVRLQPVGSAPALRQRVFKITSTQHFSTVVNFLRKKLSVSEGESVFCYINSVFAPSGDEVVGNLWSCFKTGDELVVAYAMMPAFG